MHPHHQVTSNVRPILTSDAHIRLRRLEAHTGQSVNNPRDSAELLAFRLILPRPARCRDALWDSETSQPGVFAAGDVRSGSVKRVASAVGEGAMAIRQIHQYFGT